MASTESNAAQVEKSRRIWRWVAIGAIAVLMFVVGYVLTSLRSGNEPEKGAVFSGDAQDSQAPKLASLDSLLPGLEAKVKANPKDVGNRTLLAQTYAELGHHDKAIEQYRQLLKDAPGNNETRILFATSLIQNGTPDNLKEASSLLDDAVRAKPAVAPMARLYQGEIRIKLGDKAGAIKIWKDYVKTMSAGDPRRQMFEDKIAQASGRP